MVQSLHRFYCGGGGVIRYVVTDTPVFSAVLCTCNIY